MLSFKSSTVLLVTVVAMSSLSHAGTSKHGVTVNQCEFDYDSVNFCTDDKMKAYAKALKDRKPNFDKDKILYIFEEDKSLMDEPESYIKNYYRAVVINTKDKTVSPAGFGITEAKDYDGSPIPVNNKGELLEYDFNIKSNKFCFKGNWNQYRRGASYDGEPYCFIYEKESPNKYKTFQFDVN